MALALATACFIRSFAAPRPPSRQLDPRAPRPPLLLRRAHRLLVLVVVAGLLHVLFFRQARVRVSEGTTLSGAAAFELDEPGVGQRRREMVGDRPERWVALAAGQDERGDRHAGEVVGCGVE